jgi:hypothetical protein
LHPSISSRPKIFDDDETIVIKPDGGFVDITDIEKDELTGETRTFYLLYRKKNIYVDDAEENTPRFKFDEVGSKRIISKKKYINSEIRSRNL